MPVTLFSHKHSIIIIITHDNSNKDETIDWLIDDHLYSAILRSLD